jgi:hypothetical protein
MMIIGVTPDVTMGANAIFVVLRRRTAAKPRSARLVALPPAPLC